MKTTIRKFRVMVRRSAVTKHLVTILLAGAGILSFLIMCGEPEEGMEMMEYSITKITALALFAVDYLLAKKAYKAHLLTDSFYFNEKWA